MLSLDEILVYKESGLEGFILFLEQAMPVRLFHFKIVFRIGLEVFHCIKQCEMFEGILKHVLYRFYLQTLARVIGTVVQFSDDQMKQLLTKEEKAVSPE